MRDIDIIILGGGLAGCAAARQAALQGCRAAIVERRGMLGHEIIATDRTWLRNGSSASTLPVLGGSLRKQLLQEQLDAGHVPLFFSAAAAIAAGGQGAAGVLIGNKYGLQLLEARAVIDTTDEGIAGRLLGTPTFDRGPALVRYVMEMDSIGYFFEQRYQVPEGLELLGDEIVCRESVKSRTLQIEFAFESRLGAGRRNARAMLESEAKRRAYRLASWLREHVEAFASARLSYLPSEARVVWEDGSPAASGEVRLTGLYRLAAPQHAELSTDDLKALEEEAGRLMARVACELPAAPRPVERFAAGGTELPVAGCAFKSFEDRRLEVSLTGVSFDASLVRARVEAPAIIAGTGTAGTMALAAMAVEGLAPVVLEANSEIGGTSAVGLVSGYWNGYQGGMNRRRDRRLAGIAAEVTGKRTPTNVVAGILAQHLDLEEQMADCYLGTLVCGTIRHSSRIAGVLAVDEYGLFAVEAPVTIDATGDADVAYLGGCAYEYGDPREGIVQTSSLWGEDHWKTRSFQDERYLRDLDMVCNEHYSELLRGLYIGHRLGSDYRFSPMLTVRESRRIVGEYRLTMRDIIQETIPDDLIGVTQTPVDFHGRGSGYFVHLGLYETPFKLKARIPYRCYIPRGVEGLLVTGKSFSSSRDAACIGRMNADLRHAGYALGLAAVMAVRTGVGVRGIDMQALQQQLTEREILPDWAFQPPDTEEAGAAGPEIGMLRRMTGPSEDTVPAHGGTAREAAPQPDVAEAAAASAEEMTGQERLVRAWFEDAAALDELAEELTGLVRSGRLERVSAASEGEDKECNRFIIQCAALLGKSGHPKYVPTLALVLAAAGPGGPVTYKQTAYGKGRTDAHRVPHHARLLTLCHAAERLADPALATALARLLGEETLSGYVMTDRYGDVPPFSCSYLEVALARAAARCTSRAGVERLIDYMDDARYALSQLAHDELVALSGHDLGYEPAAWRTWLAEQPQLAAVPYRGPVLGYDEVI